MAFSPRTAGFDLIPAVRFATLAEDQVRGAYHPTRRLA